MQKCSEVMTKNPVCCQLSDLVVKAARQMKSENIGSILVLGNDKDQKLVGIVTDRDLVMKIIAEGIAYTTTKLEDVMSREVVTCRADDNVQVALDAMSRDQLRRIPVVDNDNQLVGIIAQADIATRVDRPEKTAEMVKDISQAAGQHLHKSNQTHSGGFSSG